MCYKTVIVDRILEALFSIPVGDIRCHIFFVIKQNLVYTWHSTLLHGTRSCGDILEKKMIEFQTLCLIYITSCSDDGIFNLIKYIVHIQKENTTMIVNILE